MVKIAVIGNVGNSVFLTVDHFHAPGETVFAGERFEEIGSKALNQAVAAVRMGAQVSFLAAVGDDGDFCKQEIERQGITPVLPKKPGKYTTFAFILTDRAGENRVTVCRGAELEPADVDAFSEHIRQADILLLQNEVPESVNARAMELADRYGVRVILNPAPARKSSGKVWLVTPNEQEQTGLGALAYEHCVTTLGSRGCSIDQQIVIPAKKLQPVDTTGAGDTFNGILAVCLAEGMDLETACRWAVAGSGLSVTRKGVLHAIPYRKEIEL